MARRKTHVSSEFVITLMLHVITICVAFVVGLTILNTINPKMAQALVEKFAIFLGL